MPMFAPHQITHASVDSCAQGRISAFHMLWNATERRIAGMDQMNSHVVCNRMLIVFDEY